MVSCEGSGMKRPWDLIVETEENYEKPTSRELLSSDIF